MSPISGCLNPAILLLLCAPSVFPPQTERLFIAIHSIDELKEFLETHTEYELVDEYGEPCDIKELLKMNKA